MSNYKSINKTPTKSTNSVKHRLAQFLLSSSCSAGAAATTIATANTNTISTTPKLSKHLRNIPRPVEFDKYEYRPRRKLDRPTCNAPIVKVSIDCSRSARRSESSRPLLLERKNSKQYKPRDGEARKCVSAAPASPFSSIHCCYNEPKRKEWCGNNKGTGSSARKLNAIRKEARKLLSNGYDFSTNSSSSFDATDDDVGFFTSGESEEENGSGTTMTRALLSAKSFSSDSSEFYTTRRNRKYTKRPPARRSRGLRGRDTTPLVSVDSEEEKGMAVVKRSSDPYMDFRSSMVEMVVERELKSREELERLLNSYLVLNSERHRGVIVEAFQDIWEAIFGKSYPHS